VQLQQVVLNLIVNAIQSMSGVEDGNRELHMSTVSIEPEGVRVAVRDTGPGLSPESPPRLFEPFYTTKPEGMGMGLSICRLIIEAHGGRLWATSCEPQGALFHDPCHLSGRIVIDPMSLFGHLTDVHGLRMSAARGASPRRRSCFRSG
jgi:signal transduction histidine kinase